MEPKIIINFKTYTQSSGQKALELAHHIQTVNDESGIDMCIAPQAVDLTAIRGAVDVPIYAQHIDPIDPGSHTGLYLPEALMEAGINGTLINHSERRLHLADIDKIIQISKKYNLTSIACADNIRTSAAAAALGPDYVAIEPPELIGTGIPVSIAKPEIVENTVTAIRKVDDKMSILCGAGITSGEDLKAALDLGTEGVLLASGVIKADDQLEALRDIVSKI